MQLGVDNVIWSSEAHAKKYAKYLTVNFGGKPYMTSSVMTADFFFVD
jgi:hypothetical protein